MSGSSAQEVPAHRYAHRSARQPPERRNASGLLANQFEMSAGPPLFHTIIVHFEDEIPIAPQFQITERRVNP